MNISKIRKVMSEEGIVFSFSGMISQSLTSFMLEAAKTQLENSGEDTKMIRSMFHIAVEQLQNIMSYSKEKDSSDKNRYISPGVLVIGYNEELNKYYVNSSNEIYAESISEITEKLEHINSLDKDSLRKLLRVKLRSAEDKHNRGAGVGFIEIAKRSSEKLEYSFEEIEGKHYFHILAYV